MWPERVDATGNPKRRRLRPRRRCPCQLPPLRWAERTGHREACTWAGGRVTGAQTCSSLSGFTRLVAKVVPQGPARGGGASAGTPSSPRFVNADAEVGGGGWPPGLLASRSQARRPRRTFSSVDITARVQAATSSRELDTSSTWSLQSLARSPTRCSWPWPGLCGHGGDRDRVGRAGTGGQSGSRTFIFPVNRSLLSPAPVRSRREGPRGHGDLVTFV